MSTITMSHETHQELLDLNLKVVAERDHLKLFQQSAINKIKNLEEQNYSVLQALAKKEQENTLLSGVFSREEELKAVNAQLVADVEDWLSDLKNDLGPDVKRLEAALEAAKGESHEKL